MYFLTLKRLGEGQFDPSKSPALLGLRAKTLKFLWIFKNEEKVQHIRKYIED